MDTKEVSTQAFTLEGASKLEPTTTEQEYRSIPSTLHGGEVSTQVPEEFFRLYDPIRQRFTSMHERFLTLPRALSTRAHYIERTTRGIRIDTIDWIRDTIIVKVDRDKNIIEAYCGDCGGIVDRHTAEVVCSQCIRVIDPEVLNV